MTRLLILVAAAFVMVSAALGWLVRTYAPYAPPTYPLLELNPLLKFLALLVLVVTIIGVVGGFKRNPAHVLTAVIVSLALGALDAGLGELNTHFGWLYHGPVNFEAMAPGRIESLAILALGLFGAVLCLGVVQVKGGDRRS